MDNIKIKLSPLLLKYPKLLAAILYGNSSPEFVIPKIINFAETYDDTADQISDIKKIVHHILTKDNWQWLNKSIYKSFSGISFETGGANTNWYELYKKDSPEALFL